MSTKRTLKVVLIGLGCLGLLSSVVFLGVFGGMGALVSGMWRSDPIVSGQAAETGAVELAWTAGGRPEELWFKVDVEGPTRPFLKGPVRVWAGEELVAEGQLALEGSAALEDESGHFTKLWTSSPTHAKGHIRVAHWALQPEGTLMRAEVEAHAAPGATLRRLKVYVVDCPGPICL